MTDFPKALLPQYQKLLEDRGVPAANFVECIKWCRYFLDYCEKYPAQVSQAEHVQLFIKKLKAKKQSELQCRQAAYAVSVFFEIQERDALSPQKEEHAEIKLEAASTPTYQIKPRVPQYIVAGYEEKSSSPQWDELDF